MKTVKFTIFFLLCTLCANAQSFYRPWKSYKPVKPEISYKYIDYLAPELREVKCYKNGNSYEPVELLTNFDINKESTFEDFKNCCVNHPSRCVTNYIGTNNKTLLYTMVEKKAYRYMEWILNEGFVYDSDIDTWGVYKEVNGIMVPLRNYTPMMLACKNGDLRAAQILRERGAYLSKPENAIGLTPYNFAINYKDPKNKVFNDYIEKEYQEELQNIKNKKDYGTTFALNIVQDFMDGFEENILQNQQQFLDRIEEINKI